MPPKYRKKRLTDLCRNIIIKGCFIRIVTTLFFRGIIIQLWGRISGIKVICQKLCKKEETNSARRDKANILI